MYIGVDIGGSKILVVAGDRNHKITSQAKVETPGTSEQGLQEITHLIEQVSDGGAIKSIAVASPGPIVISKGLLYPTPSSNLTWGPTHISKHLKNHFHVPVALENDANAAALGEATVGAGRGYSTVLYVTISTGIGTGVIINGYIHHGANDTEGGHILIPAEGTTESFEEAASGMALKRRYGLYGYEITDPEIWDEYAADLAVGLHNFILPLAPHVVVIGGGVGVHFRKFEKPLKKHMAKHFSPYPHPPIVHAKYPETAVAFGALILADQASR